jgi:ribonuclease-3
VKKDNQWLNNERLEFLGDAVLDAVVGDIVFRHFDGKREGFLTNTRSKLVSRETLGKLAQEMGIDQLIMSSGHSSSHNSYMNGNAFEALVGAIYLDHGYNACMRFMEKRILNQLINLDKVAYKEVNFKSKLIEWSQKNRVKVEFRLEDQSQDENGSPTFVYTIVLEGIDGCQSRGFSKKESQQHASELTLKKLRSDSQFLVSVFAAKTARTQMEEMPVSVVPEVENHDEPMITINSQPEQVSETERTIDGMTLDDVTSTPMEKTREEIIAEAEAKAYGKA